MNELALSAIELFSGVGMLGEGVRAGLAHMGIGYRTICHVEREAHAAAVLVSRMEEGSLDAAPIWSDVTTFDAKAWRGKVDCVVAGFPCQDLSVAGRRAGLDGKRSGLFFEVTRIADDSGAWLIVLENVAGISSATSTVMDEAAAAEITGGRYRPAGDAMGEPDGVVLERAAARVVGELADLGWNAEWINVSASDVGASHGRARWFCIAWRMADAARHVGNGSGDGESRGRRGICEAGDAVGNPDEQREQQPRLEDGAVSRERTRAGARRSSGAMGDTESIGWHQGRTESGRQQGRSDVAEHGCAMADATSPRCGGWQNARTGGDDARQGSRSIKSERGCAVLADASSAGRQRHELGRACDGNRGGGESTWIS